VLDMADIERVHAMCVATHRLRATIEVFRPCFPTNRGMAVLSDVKALSDALGERGRDPDVAIDALDGFAAATPVGKASVMLPFMILALIVNLFVILPAGLSYWKKAGESA